MARNAYYLVYLNRDIYYNDIFINEMTIIIKA